MKFLGPWIIPAFLLFSCGCGYHPIGQPVAGPSRPTIAVPAFANRSTEVGLEAILANAVINTFAQTNAVKVTPFEEGADLVLEGKVHSLDNTSVAYNDVTNSTVRRVTVWVDLTLKKPDSGKVLWKDTEILQEDYVVDPNYHAGEATKSEGLRRAAVKMARKVMDKVLMVI